jgi:hypothetical protein
MALAFSAPAVAASEVQSEIDWNRAQQLNRKSKGGQTLTPEEISYLEKAKEARRKGLIGQRAGAAGPTTAAGTGQGAIDWDYADSLREKYRGGQTLTPEENAYLQKAKAVRAKAAARQKTGPSTQATSTGLVPLDQMTAQQRYKGEDGGLYGGGQNVPPTAHQQAAQRETARIVPLDAKGRPAPNGKIVLLSIGMSNTTQEFSRFKQRADTDPVKSPQVILVDGAQGGMDAARWSTSGSVTWTTVDQRLAAAGVTAQQVEAVWMKHARIQPASYGAFPAHAQELKGHILASLNIARQRFPNLRMAYLSSRIYAGYATTPLNPEPYAYESVFVVRWLIRDQIGGAPALNYDPARGAVKAPLLLWGPYLWADGLIPRRSDGLIWKLEDFAADGTHPSQTSGRDKVAGLLLNFFKNDPNARGWFVKPSAADKEKQFYK